MKRSILILICLLHVGCVSSNYDPEIQKSICNKKIVGEWEIVSVNGKIPQKIITVAFNKNAINMKIDGEDAAEVLKNAMIDSHARTLVRQKNISIKMAKYIAKNEAYTEWIENYRDGKEQPKIGLVYYIDVINNKTLLGSMLHYEEINLIFNSRLKFIDNDNIKLSNFNIDDKQKNKELLSAFKWIKYMHLKRIKNRLTTQ